MLDKKMEKVYDDMLTSLRKLVKTGEKMVEALGSLNEAVREKKGGNCSHGDNK